MNIFFIIFILFIFNISDSFACKTRTISHINIKELPVLKQEKHHATVSKRIVSKLITLHYCQFDFNEDFLKKIFNRYLNTLDFRHNILLESDVNKYLRYKINIIELLKKGDLNKLYNLFNLIQKKRFERFKYSIERLKKTINLNSYDYFEVDRSNSSWPKNIVELNRLWDKEIIFDWLNLKLLGKNDQEIIEKLTKRYYFILKYLTHLKSEDVFQLIINSFTYELDPHTVYLSPYDTKKFNSEITLYLDGIGVILQQNYENIIINSLIINSPAEKNKKLNIGDKIIGVGQNKKSIIDIFGWHIEDVIDLIKGPKGSKVYLKVLSNYKKSKSRIVKIIRDRIYLKNNNVKLVLKQYDKNKIAILNIPSFYIGLTNDVNNKLQKIINNNCSIVIIDLRGNGGGILNEAILLSGLFIKNGPIVQIRDSNNNIYQKIDSDIKNFYKGLLVVLVDCFSASASEIFTAAMQDYKRALIIGEPTFGKGTVQQHKTLNRIYDNLLNPEWPILGSIQYTFQKFYRVDGNSIQNIGVIPDIILSTKNIYEIGERFEKNSLKHDKISSVNYDKYNFIPKDLSFIKNRSLDRIKKKYCDIYYNYEILKCFKKNEKLISLNYIFRKKEETKMKINCINKYYLCCKSLLHFNYRQKTFDQFDFYLDESIRIAIDFKNLVSNFR
ncbi:carboxy terminal-processing peptidase [Candidatus Providencia siddallii]|uniref:Tail-specific protease n=1 Tax=Candidatus Providencia siddallii TaxID=1715285 RepID=A0ABM9NNY3_9GAMM